VKLDDLGLHLARSPAGSPRERLGLGILKAAPYLMKTLSVAGTVAMFLVGGGILTHGLPFLHHAIHHVTPSGAGALGGLLAWLVPLVGDLLVGAVAGAILVTVVAVAKRATGRGAADAG
jgi:predicted DNA repair protein MutK